ncbi:MAG TPA: Ldh family oxidoreductase [Sphingobium sp.]|nr:Ldh family oxidoreductase [Sphingobium sp.]
MKIRASEIASLAETVLIRHGVAPAYAETQVNLLLQAEMRGFASHGLLRLRRIVERIASGVSAPNATGTHEWLGQNFLAVDGQGGLGPIVALAALDTIEQRARESGIALTAIRNSNHIGMLAWYGEQMAAKGLILIAMTTSEALVHPWGGRSAMLGTNPLCIAVPANPEPLVLDMATSLVAMGKIHDYANRGVPIPAGWALDRQGDPTTDAAAAKAGAIAPFGGAKGYALGLAIEVLVTALSGAAIGTDIVGTLDSDKVCNKGDVFILISPQQGAAIEALVSAYLDDIRQCAPASPGEPVSVPGDRARRACAKSLADGVEIDAGLWRDLQSLDQISIGKVNLL